MLCSLPLKYGVVSEKIRWGKFAKRIVNIRDATVIVERRGYNDAVGCSLAPEKVVRPPPVWGKLEPQVVKALD